MEISRTKESQYTRSLIEASLDPFVTISLEGKITDVNEASIKITGISRTKLIGTDFSDYFTEKEKAKKAKVKAKLKEKKSKAKAKKAKKSKKSKSKKK